MNDNFDDYNSIVELIDEDGNTMEFELLGIIEYESEEYVTLLPDDELENSGEVIILKIEKADDGTESYVGVEDEAKLQAVFEIFKDRFIDDFDFI